MKISLRSALMAGGSLSERKQVRAIIQSLYDLRSSVAHTGKTSQTVKVKGYGKVKVDKFIQQAMNVTANVIISAINQGSLPDWFEEELRGSNQND